MIDIVISCSDPELAALLSASAAAAGASIRVIVLGDAEFSDPARAEAALSGATVVVAEAALLHEHMESFTQLQWCHALTTDSSALLAKRGAIRVAQRSEHSAAAKRKRALEHTLSAWRAQHDEVTRQKEILEAEVDAALAMLRSLSTRDLAEIQHYVHPPPMAKITLEAVHLLLGAPMQYRGLFRSKVPPGKLAKVWPPPWSDVLRETRKDTFVPAILTFEPESIAPVVWASLSAYTSQPDFNPTRGSRTSKVIGILVRWVLALESWIELMSSADGRRNPLVAELDALERANAPALRELADVERCLARSAASWSLTSVPSQFFAPAAAEYCLAWLLALEHSVCAFVSAGSAPPPPPPPPRRLKDLTVVLFGAGRVGRAVAARLRVAGVKTIYAIGRHARDERFAAIAAMGSLASFAFVAKCVEAADCIINTLPASAAAEARGKLAPHLSLPIRGRGATYISIGHDAALLSPAELLAAVRSGSIRGAVVDDVHQAGILRSGHGVDWRAAASHTAITVTPAMAGGGRAAALRAAAESFELGLKAFTSSAAMS